MASVPPRIPLLLCAADGRVRAQNDACAQALGDGRGKPCHELVRARDPDGWPLCSATCAASLLQVEGPPRDRSAIVRAARCRLVCTALGQHVVVQLLPAPRGVEGADLTPRETEAMTLVAAGHTSRQIAERMGVTLATARTHVENALRKLGARTRAEAVARLRQACADG